MQNVEEGLIVRSISGHDKKEIYIIIKKDKRNNYVYVSDGKKRLIDLPKKKNVKHIAKIGRFENFYELINNNKLDNACIIKNLKDYR